jgi:hypothetical protein
LLLPAGAPVWFMLQWWPGIGADGAAVPVGGLPVVDVPVVGVLVVGTVTLVVGVLPVPEVVVDDAALASAAPPPTTAPTAAIAAIVRGIRLFTSVLLSWSPTIVGTVCRSDLRSA